MSENQVIQVGNLIESKWPNPTAGRVYDAEGTAPTLNTMTGGGREPMIVEVIGGIGEKKSNSGTQFYQQDRIYNKDKLSPALNSSGEDLAPKTIDAVAMRGRDKNNPSFRGKSNENFEQRLENNPEGIANTLTTVQKDNMVLIRQATKDGLIPCKIGGR